MAPADEHPGASPPKTDAHTPAARYTPEEIAYFAGFIYEDAPKLLMDAAMKHPDVAEALAAAAKKKREEKAVQQEDKADQQEPEIQAIQQEREANLKRKWEKELKEKRREQRLKRQREKRQAAVREAAKGVLDFNNAFMLVWHWLHPDGDRTGIRAFHASGEASRLIEYRLKEIRDAITDVSPYETKLSAINTIICIYQEICRGTDVIPHEVRKNTQEWSAPFMFPIIEKTMSGPEMERLAKDDVCKRMLLELQPITKGLCSTLHEDVNAVVDFVNFR